MTTLPSNLLHIDETNICREMNGAVLQLGRATQRLSNHRPCSSLVTTAFERNDQVFLKHFKFQISCDIYDMKGDKICLYR